MSTKIRSAVITGGGSGIGRAIATKLSRHRWQVALVGRNTTTLAETASLMDYDKFKPMVLPCDITDPDAVKLMAAAVQSEFGEVAALINAAGTNTSERRFCDLSVANFQGTIATNLFGAYHCVHAFLPAMVEAGEGTIVNICSEAGKQATVKAGAAYVASKFGMAGLTQSINAEERNSGIRACCMFLGDVATSFLDRRPNPPLEIDRARMLQPEDVAECVYLALSLPSRALMEEIVLRPRVTPTHAD